MTILHLVRPGAAPDADAVDATNDELIDLDSDPPPAEDVLLDHIFAAQLVIVW